MKRPIRLLGLLAAGLLVGTALAPVAAQQQQSGVDGQVALRSDGALYIISNGQRRWVATAMLSDDEINALPEGQPILTGLAPVGSTQASAPSQPKPSTSNTAPAASSSPQAGSGSGQQPQAAARPTATPDANLSTDIPIEVDIDGDEEFEPGDSFRVEVRTRRDVVCEVVAVMPDGSELAEDSSTAPTDGKCRFTIEIPRNMKTGDGVVRGFAREGGKYNTAEVPFSVVSD